MSELNNIPKHWQVKRLFEIGKVINGDRGKNYPSRAHYVEYGVPFVSAGNIEEYYINSNNLNFISKDKFEALNNGKLQNRDIIYCLRGSLGKCAISNLNEGAISSSLCILRLDQTIEERYVYYYLCSPFGRAEILKHDNGTAQPNLSAKNFSNYIIPIPPLHEQLSIVSKIEELLSDLENGKQQLLTAQQQLKVYRQSLLKAAFEGRLTNKEVKDGELPEGWKWVTITDLAENNKHALKAGPFGSALKKEFYVETGYKIYGQEQVIIDNPNFGDYYVNEEKYQELKSCRIKPFDILISLVGTVGKVLILPENCMDGIINPRLIKISLNRQKYLPKFFKYYFESSSVKAHYKSQAQGTTMDVLNLGIIKKVPFPLTTLEEQQRVIDELESKLTVCDKIEETINQSLQQAETLKQSILKKAFEGRLVKPQPTKVVAKPKNEYFYQMQLLALIAKASKEHNIEHGEMTLAKYAYLLDKVYGIPTYYDYNRWHLGPYPPEMKKAINNKQYFSRKSNHIIVVNEDKLLKYTNSYETNVIDAIDDLASIFEKYPVKERADKTELLATVCKVVEDIKTTDITEVRKSMQDWKIELDNCPFKNKAEKFSIEETEKCLKFLVQREWIAKLINKN
ncbi:restriction modification system DNA specificity domain [Paludibacter propionicigenes WB4]|uniref:Restriction modification system DNA specificity domain n=1 Tax=Paludibacter propionicigenes (strain DSM 17365 / JCM 13257 / WB4) TaxID=694427 RepID=E4T0M3_PALPW|nr:restriction endonuclease subunit S [Paludibacter propionicigenes]ADQ81087.1 restriction modification system DNA specificity domain [Paludibacter propionicigenes WB4]